MMKQTFVIIYTPGAGWLAGKSIFEQPLEEHGNYMRNLQRAGKLKMGGPFLDSAGGMAIIEVENKDEAVAILSQDPAVTGNILKAEIHPWKY